MPSTAQAQTKPLTEWTIEELCDKLGPLDAAEKLHKATVSKPRTEITDEIQARYDASPAKETFTPAGSLYALIVGPKKLERKITDRGRFKRALGSYFVELWEVGLGKADKALDQLKVSAKVRATFMSEALTGARSITSVRKPESD